MTTGQEPRALAKVEGNEQSSLTQMDEAAIQSVKHNLEMLAKMVDDILIEGQDYGIIPGAQSKKPSLWDGGATNIRAGFNCYSVPNVVDTRDDGEHVRYVVRADIVSRKTGKVVAAGIGTASTKEVKYAFRWVFAPEEYGFDRKALRSREVRGGNLQYRIPNPDIEDLDNTIIKMASKRAEVDATMQLPGVARKFTQDMGVKLAPKVAPPVAGEQDDGDKPTPQEAPRGFCPDHPDKPFVERDGPRGKWWACGTRTGERDGKATWCQRRPSDAPARAPEAKAGVVVPADKATPKGGTPDPKTIGEVGQLAKDVYGIGFADLLKIFNVKSLDKVTMAPADAWYFVKDYAEKQGLPSAAEKDVFGEGKE